MQDKPTKWSFDIDRGGTFTDIVAHRDGQASQIFKVLSHAPQLTSEAPIYGIKKALGLDDEDNIPPGMVSEVRMGTTVATNALLERKGAKTLFITNKGFRDVLEIAYQQRPHLFKQPIVKPDRLYSRVVEIEGRLNASGKELEPANGSQILKLLEEAKKQGFESIAVCLMHSYLNAKHEELVEKLAQPLSFNNISLSSKIMPLIKMVSRGDTTVIDAYLSPILKDYTDKIAEHLPGTRVLFMQSHGGLCQPHHFRGYNAILSGPAGGVIAAVETTKPLHFDKVIGFDMGGTSTDVCHYAGDWERSREHRVAGVRLQTPMLDIHTIAAGGGSCLSFDGYRFSVGPRSAGSFPGPTSYGNGGPLTITDCNVLLSKIDPDYFPAVFGPSRKAKLDRTAVTKSFEKLADMVNRTTAKDKTIYQIAEGCLKIACQHMAAAIKKISIERGHALTEYVLSCFGSAGGQHACLVADELQLKRIHIHPFGGVFSAYGIGLASITALKERSCQFSFDQKGLSQAQESLKDLYETALQEVLEQGVKDDQIESHSKLYLGYLSSDNSLKVDLSDLVSMRKQFDNEHQKIYGFTQKDSPLEIKILEVEVRQTRGPQQTAESHVMPLDDGDLPDKTRFYSGGQWREARLKTWSELSPAEVIAGPAVILSKTQTIIVEPTWQALLLKDRSLLLEKTQDKQVLSSDPCAFDPIKLEIFNHRFRAIAEEMGVRLAQTAHSVNIKERLDFSCALFDKDGDLIANAPHVPVHLGSMSEAIKGLAGRLKGRIQKGDHYAHNDPASGGTHLPDITVITPVFIEEATDPDFYVASRGHHADVGGISPGSMPAQSTTLAEEGIVLKDLLLVRKKQWQKDSIVKALRAGPHPARNLQQNLADLSAQVAANEKGVSDLTALCLGQGKTLVLSYMNNLKDYADQCVRRIIKTIKDHHYVLRLDEDRQIKVKVSYDNTKDICVIDFTGSSSQDKGNFNAPTAVTKAAVLFVLRSLVDEDIPLNEGCLKHVELIIPQGSLLNPDSKAAVVSGNVETSQAVANALFAAMAKLAPSPSTMNNLSFGNADFQYYETICQGSGAGDGFNGCDAVQVHMTNSKLTDPEIFEKRYPIRLRRFEIVHDTGGKGQSCGGNGVEREIEFLSSCKGSIVSGNRQVAAAGLCGGEAGQIGRNLIVSNNRTLTIKGCASFNVDPGDCVIIRTPGGGGYGKPP